MNFAVPVTDVSELEILAQAGAGEFYCGVMDKGWQDLFGNHDSISRRQGLANVSSLGALSQIASEAGKLNCPVYLTLNSRYTEPQLDLVENIACRWEQMGGTGLQIFDIGLMYRLNKRNHNLRLSLSLMGVAMNSFVLDFYKAFHISRVVLPRCLNPIEMKDVLSPHADIEAEAMVMLDKCRFIDGFCHFYHGVAYQNADNSNPSIVNTIETFDTGFSQHQCSILFPSDSGSLACAACKLEQLEKSGIAIGKIGGRGSSLDFRVKCVSFLKKTEKMSTADRALLYRQTFDSSCNCYY